MLHQKTTTYFNSKLNKFLGSWTMPIKQHALAISGQQKTSTCLSCMKSEKVGQMGMTGEGYGRFNSTVWSIHPGKEKVNVWITKLHSQLQSGIERRQSFRHSLVYAISASAQPTSSDCWKDQSGREGSHVCFSELFGKTKCDLERGKTDIQVGI